MYKYLFLLPLLTLLVFYSSLSSAKTDAHACSAWPPGMLFMGLTNGDWRLFLTQGDQNLPQQLPFDDEPRTPVLSPLYNTIAYINYAGELVEYSLENKKNRILLGPSREASYAQPEYDEKNNRVYVVELKQGISVDTDILTINRDTQEVRREVIQRSAQFEPFLDKDSWLYYGNVHCVLGCGDIIQEIWRRHTISGKAEQITLLNNISRQPFVYDQWLYFSSNLNGNYHLYRQSLNTRDIEQLTEGVVTDMSPSIYQDTLYYIRHNAQGSQIMCQTQKNKAVVMTLPASITMIRDLVIRS